MNFKDVYKSANDDIHGDRLIMDALLRGENSKRKKPLLLKPTLSCGLAVAAVLAIVAFVYPRHTAPVTTVKPQVAVHHSDNSTDTYPSDDKTKSVTDGIEPQPNTTSVDEHNQNGTANADVKTGTIQSDMKTSRPEKSSNATSPNGEAGVKVETKKPASVQNSAMKNSVAENTPKTANANTQANSADADKPKKSTEAASAAVKNGCTLAVNSVSVPETAMDMTPYGLRAAGFSGSASFDEDGTELQTLQDCYYDNVTPEEYADYLGINLMEKIKLPQDMHFLQDAYYTVEKSAETDAIVNDTVVFTAVSDENDNRNINITASKIQKEAQGYLENETYQKSIINGNSAVVIGDEQSLWAYTQIGDADISVTAVAVSTEELKELLLSVND